MPTSTAYQNGRRDAARAVLVSDRINAHGTNRAGALLIITESLVDQMCWAAWENVVKTKRNNTPGLTRDIAWHHYTAIADYCEGAKSEIQKNHPALWRAAVQTSPFLFRVIPAIQTGFGERLAKYFTRNINPAVDSIDPKSRKFFQHFYENATNPDPNPLDPLWIALAPFPTYPTVVPAWGSLFGSQLEEYCVSRLKAYFLACAIIEPTMRTEFRSERGKRAREFLENPLMNAADDLFGDNGLFGENGPLGELMAALQALADFIADNAAFSFSSAFVLGLAAVGAFIIAKVT